VVPGHATLLVGEATIILRPATSQDVPGIVRLLAADQLGATRDDASGERLQPYLQAFRAIDADPAHQLVVGADGAVVVATMQVSFLPGLARRGALRAQIEAVRVQETYRGRGLGEQMLGWAIGEATQRGCALVQLTSDKSRGEAHRFYERLGFVASHDGFKLGL
jgi:GNAT superfamily N-acetyltransferase